MKKILATLLALVMALSLAACGGKSGGDTQQPADGEIGRASCRERV